MVYARFYDSSSSGLGGLFWLTSSLAANLSGDALIVLVSTSCGLAASNSSYMFAL
jgi:hypothetical protein